MLESIICVGASAFVGVIVGATICLKVLCYLVNNSDYCPLCKASFKDQV